MQPLQRVPRPPLDRWVDRLWMLGDAPPHPRERIVPTGTLELVVNLAEDEIRVYHARSGRVRRHSGAVVSGAFSTFFTIDTRTHASIIGVHFAPGGAFPFLGSPPAELADEHVDLEALWGSAARELRERLCAAAGDDRFRILEDALLARLVDPVRQHPVVPFALARLCGGADRVCDVADSAGLSHRRFIEVFRAEVGMAPKLFAQIRRLDRAIARTRHASVPDWTRIAVECGYFDQSHLIRDFVAFSGFTPSDFVRHSSEHIKDEHLIA